MLTISSLVYSKGLMHLSLEERNIKGRTICKRCYILCLAGFVNGGVGFLKGTLPHPPLPPEQSSAPGGG